MTDYPDYQTPQAHASAIYAQRVPLAKGTAAVGSAINQTVAANTSQQVVTTAVFDQPAIQATLAAKLPAAAGGTPFAQLWLVWFDSATNLIIAERKYSIGSGDNVLNVAGLIGVARGQLLNVDIVNLHATQPLTYDWSVAGISHVPADDDWRQDNPNPVNTFTLPGGDPTAGVLAVINAAVAVGTPVARMTAASNRLCRVVVDNTGGTSAVSVVISDPAPALPLYGSTAGAEFWSSGAVSPGGLVNDFYQMPNGPALVTVTNLATTGPVTPKITITTLQRN